ncbi:MAG: adenylate kinase [Clostridia bacterium]|nr:adenylate kinase [Clostridia bacterium]
MKTNSFRLVLLGAPGAGKGTQAERLAEKFSVPQISTGVILRAAIEAGTPLGLKVKELIENGKLVSDEDVVAIVGQRIAEKDCENGFILDGFPRTIPQAEALENLLEERGLTLDAVLSIEVNDSDIVSRMSGRRVCKKCGASYHVVYKRPRNGNLCDNCSSELTIREDDKVEVVMGRLEAYHKQTAPLKEYYAAKGLLVAVEGKEELSETSAAVDEALENL